MHVFVCVCKHIYIYMIAFHVCIESKDHGMIWIDIKFLTNMKANNSMTEERKF